MTLNNSLVSRGVIAGLVLLPMLALGAPQSRIQGRIETAKRVTLPTNIHTDALRATDLGPVDSTRRIDGMTLQLRQTPEQAADLEQFLEQQRDPGSPNFNNWLTPEQFGDRFGVSASDLGAITSWLSSEGFTVNSVARASYWISFSGNAGQVARTFGAELHRLSLDGEEHFSNLKAPMIPAALSGMVATIDGLHDFRPKPNRSIIRRPKANPDYTSGSTHYLAPGDLAAIYDINPLYSAGYDGTGQTLAIAGQTDLNLTDIATFRSNFGLSAKAPTVILTGTDPGVSSADVLEAALDVEWSGAIARNATVIYVNSTNVFTSMQYAIDQNVAPILSISYGTCETGVSTTYRAMMQQANAQGMTVLASSGDSGAAGCDYSTSSATHGPAVSFPASVPEVTAVGGSEFAEAASSWNSSNGSYGASATGYLAETSWNDTATTTTIEASGGGQSTMYPKPWWQTGTGVPTADTGRDVPDVSLSASAVHDGYLVQSGGAQVVVGGTSASTPSFAGILTLLNHYLTATGALTRAGLGNANANLYSLASKTGVFHDITTGNNIVPCTAGSTGCPTGNKFGFSAGVGYDKVTGIGSVDAYNLATSWTSASTGVGTTITVTASPTSFASTSSTTVTATVKAVSGTTVPTGTVQLTVGTTTLGSGTLNASGVATITVAGSTLTSGSNTIEAAYLPTGTFKASAASVAVTVTLPPAAATTTTVTASPASISSAASTTLTSTVKAVTGTTVPAGTVTFSAGSTTLGSVTLNTSGTASLSVSGSKLAVGANTITATFAPSNNVSPSSGTVSVTVTAPVATTTTVTAAPASGYSNGTTTVTVTVKAASGSTVPAGTVAFTLGSTSLGTLTLSGGTASSTLNLSGFPVGSDTVTATYTSSNGFAASAGSVAITVAAPIATTTTVTASPSTVTSATSTTLTVTVKPASGTAAATGTVTVTLGKTTLGTVTLSSGTGTLTVKSTSFSTGSNTVTASYGGAVGFATSSGTVVITK